MAPISQIVRFWPKIADVALDFPKIKFDEGLTIGVDITTSSPTTEGWIDAQYGNLHASPQCETEVELSESSYDWTKTQIDGASIDKVVHHGVQEHNDQYNQKDVVNGLDVFHFEQIRQQWIPRHEHFVW